jgi:hypothetical protein
VVFCSCGIDGMWRESKYVTEFSLSVSFKNVKDRFSLAGLGSWWDLPWCIGGDFNVGLS